MPITVHSPFSGHPVKIRDQDVGRAVRDEENRIFYVVERADGSGWYGAPTRTGNPRDEQRYDELVAKMQQAKASGQAQSARQVHDARGQARSGVAGKLVALVVALVVGVGAYLFFSGKLQDLMQDPATQPAPQAPANPSTPEAPQAPEAPEAPETPDASATPAAPSLP